MIFLFSMLWFYLSFQSLLFFFSIPLLIASLAWGVPQAGLKEFGCHFQWYTVNKPNGSILRHGTVVLLGFSDTVLMFAQDCTSYAGGPLSCWVGPGFLCMQGCAPLTHELSPQIPIITLIFKFFSFHALKCVAALQNA